MNFRFDKAPIWHLNEPGLSTKPTVSTLATGRGGLLVVASAMTLSLTGCTFWNGPKFDAPAAVGLPIPDGLAGVLVDAAAPTVVAITTPPAGAYAVGDSLVFSVRFSKDVMVTGVPRLDCICSYRCTRLSGG